MNYFTLQHTRVFYHLYDLKKEGIPNEEEWDMRIEQVGLFAWQPPGEKAGGQPGGQLLGGQEPSGQLHSGQGHQQSLRLQVLFYLKT